LKQFVLDLEALAVSLGGPGLDDEAAEASA
jgi:hypothetical protein